MKTYIHIFSTTAENIETFIEIDGQQDLVTLLQNISQRWDVPLEKLRCFTYDKRTFETARCRILATKSFDTKIMAFVKNLPPEKQVVGVRETL